MKPWSGKDFKYNDFDIHNNKKDGYLEIYKDGKYVDRIWNISHGSITTVKDRIDYLIKEHSKWI